MYVDHLKADFTIFGKSESKNQGFIPSQIKKCRENKYYKLMEGVRNYAQHVRMPISGISIDGQWSKVKGKKGTCYHALKVHASKKDLSRIREVRKTLAEFDEIIDLKFALGKYVSVIGSLHGEVRKEMNELVLASRVTFENWIEKYATASGEKSSLGLAAIKTEKDAIFETIDVHLKWDDIRLELSHRNRGLRDFSINYVTTISETTIEMERKNKDTRC